MDKKYKHSFEPQISNSLLMDLHLLAGEVLRGYYSEVKPVLLFCGLQDDSFIRKIFEFKDMKPIYLAAMEKNSERMNLLEDLAFSKGEDFWEPMRDPNCKVKKPLDNGFVFRRLPWVHNWIFDKLVKTILIKDGGLSTDEKLIRKESLCYPTDRMRELYDLAEDFCEAVNAMKIKRPYVSRWLFMYDKDGNLKPCKTNILFSTVGG